MHETKAIRTAVMDVLYENPELFKVCLKLVLEDIGYDLYGQVRAGVVSQIRSHSKVLDGIDDTAILKPLRIFTKSLISPLVESEDLAPELAKLESTILERFEVKEEE